MNFLNSLSKSYLTRCLSAKPSEIKFNWEKMERYEEAILALNGLQSNASYIRNRSYKNSSYEDDFQLTIAHTRKLLSNIGINKNDLNKLSIIHVAGTKGKGSTCAYTESVLRRHGYKTGFYSSPHLFEVRERIRINGVPLTYGKFAEYFWQIYDILKSPENLPLEYFRFLTIMAFQVFIREKVDVAILEVGIGGEFDNTNIVENVPIVGITSLGIDHTSLLGDTIKQIAWHKAGIIKCNSKVFTVPQPIEAAKVLIERTREKQATLQVIQPFLNSNQRTNLYPEVNDINASLGVILAYYWMKNEKGMSMTLEEYLKTPETEKGLSGFSWPGRFQTIKRRGTTYFLDGAHTTESVIICKKWYESKALKSKKGRALIFNMIGQRDSEKLLAILMQCDFDKVIFVPNISGVCNTSDNKVTDSSYYADKCNQHRDNWLKLLENNGKKIIEENVLILPNVLAAVDFLDSSEYNCLVTGSIHLMGAALEVLNPDLKY